MSSKEVSLLGWWYSMPKIFRYPFLIILVSIPFVVLVVFGDHFGLGDDRGWLVPYQVIAVGTIIAIQIWNARRSFNKCKTCGHERHMHDKIDLNRKGFSTLSTVVCDKFEDGYTDDIPVNYRNLYWNGQDPRDDPNNRGSV